MLLGLLGLVLAQNHPLTWALLQVVGLVQVQVLGWAQMDGFRETNICSVFLCFCPNGTFMLCFQGPTGNVGAPGLPGSVGPKV